MAESAPDSDSNYALSLVRDAMHHILYAAPAADKQANWHKD